MYGRAFCSGTEGLRKFNIVIAQNQKDLGIFTQNEKN